MTLRIYIDNDKVYLEYSPDNGTSWIDEIFEKGEGFTTKKTFHLTEQDVAQSDDEENNDDSKIFIIGELENNYYKIYSRVLGTRFDVLFHTSCSISIKYFIVNNNISILYKFERLANQKIIIGGDNIDSIPENVYKEIVNSFPTRTELKHYADSRITNVISQYLEGVKDSGKAFEKYLENRDKIENISSIKSINKYEYDKYAFILQTLKDMLQDSDKFKESVWQEQILDIILILYPKYIRCFSEVQIKDYYTNPKRTTNRYIDLMLVDSNGNIDVIEIKKPFSNCVITKRTYRDNYTPLKELSGTVMQVEKYLFHLNKWGINGEKTLLKKYITELPKGLDIRITNPKGIIILGRDNNLTTNQLFDLEIIKRKYSNIMDITTYDDLLKRLENILSKFK